MADVTLTANLQPAPACYPPDINTLLELIAGGGITASIQDSLLGGAYRGSTAPSSPVTNPIWYVVDGAGRPQGIKLFYNGNWRPMPTAALGDIRMFSGLSTEFDGTGRGNVNTWHDGWALCNGNNGTPNLANRFVVAASQYSSGWQANPDGTGMHYSGGDGVIRCVNLPDLWASGYAAVVQTSGSGTLVLTNQSTNQPMDIQIKDLINNCQPAGQQPLVPPYYALAYIMYVGYQ